MAADAGSTACIFPSNALGPFGPNSPIMVILVAILVVTLFIIRGIPARQLAVNDGLPPGHQGNSSLKLRESTHYVRACTHEHHAQKMESSTHVSTTTLPNQFLSAFVPGAVHVVTMGAESDSSSPSKLHDPAHVPHRARAHHCFTKR
jgi:hypothetical protein